MQNNQAQSTSDDMWAKIILIVGGVLVAVAATPLWVPALLTWWGLHTLLRRIRGIHQVIASLIAAISGFGLWQIDPLHENATIYQLNQWLVHVKHGEFSTFPWHFVPWGILLGVAWWAAIRPIIQYFHTTPYHDNTFDPDPTTPPAPPSSRNLNRIQRKAMQSLKNGKEI